MALTKERYSTRDIDAPPENGQDWRVLYANHLPVAEWTVWSSDVRAEVEAKAWRQAKADLRPGSGVFDNVFIVQHWDGEDWSEYDENGDDLTDILFGDA